MTGLYFADQGNAVHLRHPDIAKDDVRLELLYERISLQSVGSLSAYIDIEQCPIDCRFNSVYGRRLILYPADVINT